MVKISRNNSLQEEQLTEPGYYILLALLVPMHGYGISKYIEDLTEGEVSIGPATMYTMLKKMQAQDYISLAGEEARKKIYKLTDKGNMVIRKEQERRYKMALYGVKAFERIGGVE
ncbi:PadR family transcriptional regulator [Terrisporobacter mayombei]|uniref:Transcription regulator PadR N-terminal domain-containing protein n=1 Tax=Terrisporobacter mayombei TaxID=1541 RepID=A0ABY9Q504_9FIRM|nr:PadR family transcriptional regulator [Terrisporobacter mayombei]MCC3869199.1 PadR family transcriptional regulator [Terrisporobacter mayombei]WMT82664.1 hypothetical protein TEMA_31520 [Terrisporobacter mayombei]